MSSRKLLAEFIGTFMLIFVGAGAVTFFSKAQPAGDANLVIAALAHGLILVVIIATFGAISGAHVNPAVTLGLLVGGKTNLTDAVGYWIAQFLGGVFGAFVLRFIFPDMATLGNTLPAAGFGSLQIIVLEGLMTFFLVSTVYQAAVYKRSEPAALMIGFTLAACILLGGGLTGASLNPARTFGPALVTGNFTEFISYMIGIFGGGALAGLVHVYLFGKDADQA